MAENYTDIIKARIGKVQVKAKATNYFPIVGETTTLHAEMKWAQTDEFDTNDGSGESVVSAGNVVLQKDSKDITVVAEGELKQTVTARNYLTEDSVKKTIYAMPAQSLPYFEVAASEVVRVGTQGSIELTPENGFVFSSDTSAEIRFYRENEETDPVLTINTPTETLQDKLIYTFTFSEHSDRGIYDVEIDVTDNGNTLSKRINKLVTITPKLCPKPADTSIGYEVAFTYDAYTTYTHPMKNTFECHLWRDVNGSGLNYAEMIIPRGEKDNARWSGPDISSLPAGTTLVLKEDPNEPEKYPMRLFITGCKDYTVTNENGTPNFTHDLPLVITHDCEEIMQWGWRAYGAYSPGHNIRNVVIDGYGYHNTGIHFYIFDSSMFADSCMYINNGSRDIEIFGVDIEGAGFVGITAKTDPSPDRPWFWRENGWELTGLHVHHNTIRSTIGEGVYIGYYDRSQLTGTNNEGDTVTYHAHLIRDPRIYRCTFSYNGYDSVQINGAVGIDFCYNLLEGCGYRREPSQGSAFSCGMDGKIYNCIIRDNFNILGVFGPMLGKLEVFNCILTAARMEAAWVLTAWSSGLGTTEITDLQYLIYNNIVKASKIAQINGDVRYTGHEMNDNIFITEKGDTETPVYFTGSGNIFMKADIDFDYIDDYLKVADSENYDYQPAYNAPSVDAGKNGLAPFDMRGYKNWYISHFHAGPFMGKYKDESLYDVSLAMKTISINEGASITYEQSVNVQLSFNGNPTHYRIGETEDLSDVEWIGIGESVDYLFPYTLSDGFGVKTLYAQVCNAAETSKAVSSSISYNKVPLSATMVVNGGKLLTINPDITVSFNVSGYYETLQYMLSDDENFTGQSYSDYTNGASVAFTLSEKGKHTLYGRIKSEDGQEVTISEQIEYTSNKMLISMYPDYSMSPFMPDTGFNIVWTMDYKEKQLKNVSGDYFCNFIWNDNYDSGATSVRRIQFARALSSSGNESGHYPDLYTSRAALFSIGISEYKLSLANFTGLVQGDYKVTILCNTTSEGGTMFNNTNLTNKYDATENSYIVINDTEYNVAELGLDSFVDNFNHPLEFNVTVGESGIISVSAYSINEWMYVPINVIEIEKL